MNTPLFRKNIRYEWEGFSYTGVVEAARKNPDFLVRLFDDLRRMNNTAGIQETVGKLLQITSGCQFIVQKDLSDELAQVDFDNSHFEDIAWPAPSLEVYFEDPALATIIVNHSRFDGLYIELAKSLWGEDWQRRCPALTLHREPSLGAVCDNAASPTSCTVVHTFDTWQRALEAGNCDIVADKDPVLVQSMEESREMHRLLNLTLKVLAYSNIPKFLPTPVTRRQMGRGPKAGVCGRPIRPSFKCVYLPKIVRPMVRTVSDGEGASRTFKGRRGHIRHLRSEFYKQKKGEWIYIPPVVVDGIETIYKVRSVAASRS